MNNTSVRNILIVAATESEGAVLRSIKDISPCGSEYCIGDSVITLLITGVGQVATAWSLTKWLSLNDKPDLAINIGIAGSYNADIRIGEVVAPLSDCFADMAVEDGNNILTLEEAGLGEAPFNNGRIFAENDYISKLTGIIRPVSAVTVNTVTGSLATIRRMTEKYNPDIETMEGATFFYICRKENSPFIALRAISNKVEPRDRNKWDIPLALRNLSGKLEETLKILIRS